MTPPQTTASVPTAAGLRSFLLVAGMAIGSVFLWLGIPAFWVFLAAQISSPGTPAFGPILLVLLATPLSMVFFAPVLGRLDHAHRDLRGTLRKGPRRAAWTKSMRDSSTEQADTGILEVVMITSVVVALAAAGIWLALFGQMSLPGG
ncbi:hypothetical protein [Paraconexibacter sp.]|uniref:hypothetical protein n=1 Tax=Paraconexibacter sp. TaxID=2949640 RepID=UPI0035665310